MDVVAWPGGEPALDPGGLVGAVVVDDEVDLQIGGNVGVDVLEKAQELLVAVARLALGEDWASGDIQCGEEGGGAGMEVSGRDALDVAGPEGLPGRGSLQRRGRALLVHAEDHRVDGRIQVESDEVAGPAWPRRDWWRAGRASAGEAGG